MEIELKSLVTIKKITISVEDNNSMCFVDAIIHPLKHISRSDPVIAISIPIIDDVMKELVSYLERDIGLALKTGMGA